MAIGVSYDSETCSPECVIRHLHAAMSGANDFAEEAVHAGPVLRRHHQHGSASFDDGAGVPHRREVTGVEFDQQVRRDSGCRVDPVGRYLEIPAK